MARPTEGPAAQAGRPAAAVVVPQWIPPALVHMGAPWAVSHMRQRSWVRDGTSGLPQRRAALMGRLLLWLALRLIPLQIQLLS